MAALQHGAHVVIGTSGLSDADYADIAKMADQRQRGVLAVGNFALTVVLLQKFAEIAAKHIPQSATKCYSFCLSFVPARCQSLS
jgi:4-hydroxy-tetrahydrodipicolinate reductase